MKAPVLHLEWQNIVEIDNLELFHNVKYLHLQYNSIEKIQNLEFLIQLEFLTLEGNKITYIQGIRTLRNLVYLNLAKNHIILLNTNEIPKEVSILKLNENPCSSEPDYRSVVISELPELEELDGDFIRPEERMRIFGIRIPDNFEAPVDNQHFDESEEYSISIEKLASKEKPNKREIERFMTEDEDIQYSQITEKAWEIVKRSKERMQKLLEDKVNLHTSKSEEYKK